MAESFSIERRNIMRFMGAKVILTGRREGYGHGWFLTRGSAAMPVHGARGFCVGTGSTVIDRAMQLKYSEK